ncbi:MAG: ribosome hibernation-promoting factor, HPF/YfiA family [Burkholderiaceae bacterium]
MNLTIRGHHLEITPAIREYVLAKLSRIKRHFDHVIDVTVVLVVEKLRQRVEMTLHVRGKDIHCEAADGSMYAAIDAVTDKLDRQVGRHKTKVQKHAHAPIKKMSPLDPDVAAAT